jgi:hypothetical protein
MKIIIKEMDNKNLSLGERDKLLKQIDQQIAAKQQLLIDTHLQLQKQRGENVFLTEVKDDYDKYFMFKKKQKEEQIMAMNVLNEYLKNIIENESLSEEDLLEAKRDESNILKSIQEIKAEMNKMMG